jgi:hypothetical protein
MSLEQFAEPIRAAHLRYAVHEWLVKQNEKSVLAEIHGGGKIPASVLFDYGEQFPPAFFPAHAAAASSVRSISTSKFGLGEWPSFSAGVIPVQRKKTLSPTAKYLFFAWARACIRASVIPARLPIRTSECSLPSI